MLSVQLYQQLCLAHGIHLAVCDTHYIRSQQLHTRMMKSNEYQSDIEHLIKKEFYFFYTNNTKGKFLTQVEKWLDTIRPTSVEAERCFSAAGLFASNVRNRLGDEVLSGL